MVAVDVDDGDEAVDVGPGAGEAVAEVEGQQLLLRRVEPVSRRQQRIATGAGFHHRRRRSPSCAAVHVPVRADDDRSIDRCETV